MEAEEKEDAGGPIGSDTLEMIVDLIIDKFWEAVGTVLACASATVSAAARRQAAARQHDAHAARHRPPQRGVRPYNPCAPSVCLALTTSSAYIAFCLYYVLLFGVHAAEATTRSWSISWVSTLLFSALFLEPALLLLTLGLYLLVAPV